MGRPKKTPADLTTADVVLALCRLQESVAKGLSSTSAGHELRRINKMALAHLAARPSCASDDAALYINDEFQKILEVHRHVSRLSRRLEAFNVLRHEVVTRLVPIEGAVLLPYLNRFRRPCDEPLAWRHIASREAAMLPADQRGSRDRAEALLR